LAWVSIDRDTILWAHSLADRTAEKAVARTSYANNGNLQTSRGSLRRNFLYGQFNLV